MKLPPPTTFSEGLRLLFAVAAIGFGVAVGLGMVVLVSVLVWGGWPAEYYGQILSILGWIAVGALGLLTVTQVGQLLGGPVGRFKGGISLKDGVNFDAADNADVTAQVTVSPKQPEDSK